MRNEFCPNCGERVVVSMDDIITTSQDDAARRHGEDLNGKIRVGILVLIVVITILEGFIYLYDRTLTYDGSGLPSFQANATVSAAAASETLEKPYKDPRPLPPIPPPAVRVLGHRKDPIREALRTANGGGGMEFAKGINNGLNFLVSKQEKDGGWPVSIIPGSQPQGDTAEFKWGRVGVSSLSLLAFMGDGHIWNREETGARSAFADNLKRGIKFLVLSQDETGRIGANDHHFMYNHGMATLALCEAAALSGDSELKEHAAKAVAFIVKSQAKHGGWDYYGVASSETDDISVSSWEVQALAAAREIGLDVPAETFEKALDFYTKLTKADRGVYNFQLDDGQYLPSRAGMVLMIRELLGDKPAKPDIKALSARLLTAMPKVKAEWGRGWNPATAKDALERAKFDPYMLYFCTEGIFFVGGKDWEEWNGTVCKGILTMQDIDGAWRANDGYSKQGGTCYGTALCILALQSHHRIIHSVAIKSAGGKDE